MPDVTASASGVAAGGVPSRLGPYEILEELGRGGMGRVYAARQVRLGRIVALKVMSNTLPGADLELRFLREAQTAARLRHPGIVAVHDFGRADGQAYFSMDYLEGGDLAHRLRERPFTPGEAAAMLHKVARALAYAHGEGVLHRDLKPSNILLDSGEPRLADFGLAAQLEAGGDLTMASGILGTPNYLAPEAFRGGSGALTVASDIYALGVVLFELLTGRTPFGGAAPATLAALVESSEPPSPRLLAPAVPIDLETVCLKCLEREPARRYADAAGLAEDLRRFLDGEPIIARPVAAPARFLRWCRRRPALAAVWGLICALAVGSTVAVLVIQGALTRTTKAEEISRERLRHARLAEARAVRRTTQPGRRAQVLSALAEAARIRPGTDLVNEAVSALVLPDVQPGARWNIPGGRMGVVGTDPDGQRVSFQPVTAFGDRLPEAQILSWGASNAVVPLEFPPTNAVGLVRFSRDGTLLSLRFLDGTLRCWRAGDLRPFLVAPVGPGPGGAVVTDAFNDDHDFAPDGSWLAVGLPGRGIAIRRLPGGEEIARWDGGTRFNRVRCSPDGERIAAITVMRKEARTVWVLRRKGTGWEPEHELPLSSSPNSIAWSATGRWLAVTLSDNGILVFDAVDGRLMARHTTSTREPNEVVFVARDSMLVFRGHGSSARFLALGVGREELVLDGIGPGTMQAQPAGDRVTITSVFGAITHWEMLRPVGFRALPTPRPGGYEGAFNAACIDFSPDGRLMVVSHGRFVVVQEVADGSLVAQYDAGNEHGTDHATVAFTEGGRAVIRCSLFTGIERLSLGKGPDGGLQLAPPEVLDGEGGWQMTDHLPAAKRLALVHPRDGRVRVVDLESGKPANLAVWAVPGVYAVAFHPDGSQVFVHCADAAPGDPAPRLQVRRVADGGMIATPSAPPSGEVAWSADGRVVLTSNGMTESYLWDAATWKPRAKLSGTLGGNASTFGLSPDGQYAVIVADQKVQWVSTRDGSLLLAFDSPEASGLAAGVRFLPDGRTFAVLWRDGRVDLVDPSQWQAALAPHGLGW